MDGCPVFTTELLEWGMRAGAKSQGNIASRMRIVSGDSSLGSENGKCGCTRKPRVIFRHPGATGNTVSALLLIRSLAAVLPRKTMPQSADRTQTQPLVWSKRGLPGEQLENFTHEVFLPAGRRENLKRSEPARCLERCCEEKAPAQWSSIYAQSPCGFKEWKSIFSERVRARSRVPLRRGTDVQVFKEVVTSRALLDILGESRYLLS
jgi:hypothetical protein